MAKKKPWTKRRYGLYSETAATRVGYSVCLTPDGQEVKVTKITCATTHEKAIQGYFWDDARWVGPLAKHVKDVGKGSIPHQR